MPVAFNPFNPLSYWAASLDAVTPRASDKSPIAIKVSNSDPGLKVSKGPDAVMIRGVAKGFQQVHNDFADYEVGRGMSFTLDIDKAKTTDAFGNTDYTEKNSRLFTLDTSKGWSAAEAARRLADKVNAGDDFRAEVSVTKDGGALLKFSRL